MEVDHKRYMSHLGMKIFKGFMKAFHEVYNECSSSNFFLQPCCSVVIKICVLYRSYQIKLQLLFFECQIAKVYMPKLKLEGMFYQIILQAR